MSSPEKSSPKKVIAKKNGSAPSLPSPPELESVWKLTLKQRATTSTSTTTTTTTKSTPQSQLKPTISPPEPQPQVKPAVPKPPLQAQPIRQAPTRPKVPAAQQQPVTKPFLMLPTNMTLMEIDIMENERDPLAKKFYDIDDLHLQKLE
jgi:hypothetical protein